MKNRRSELRGTGEQGMRCLYCNCTESKVIDSRSADDDKTIRRRRECTGCGRRFTTYETIETTPILVVKTDGNRQSFDIGKIKRGIIKACEKRPVPLEKIDALVEDVAKRVYNSMEQEISSKSMVMEGLKELDEVAYVRYASVYRSFKDISSFMSELQRMMEYKDGEKR